MVMVLLRPLFLLLGAVTLVAYASGDDALAWQRPKFYRRTYISPSEQSSSYDIVIAGGGLAGLVLAARLSNDPNLTILVLEAGPSGDDVANRINTPSGTYYQSLLGAAPYDWLFTSVPQTNLSGRAVNQPRGKLLGGSSAINGMYYIRPSNQEVTAWHSLIAPANASAADAWSPDSFFTAIKNTETFVPPSADLQSQMGIQYSQNSRGSSGELRTSYPGYMVPLNALWLPALKAVGIPSNPDPDSGSNLGGFIATSTINPSNWTRSYSRSAYIDSLPPRQNLHILSNATVSRIVFADNNDQYGNKIVKAIEFSSGKGTDVQTVSVNKEAILAGGAYGSPQILQVSGVGPPDVLQAANVPVLLELPGVGQRLHDHLSVPVFFNTSADTAGSIHASNSDFSQTPVFNAFVNDAVAYINGSRLFDGDTSFATFRSQIDWQFNNSGSTPIPSNYSEVIQGYKAIQQATAQNVYPTAGIVELILSINSPGVVGIQAALQQALSKGRMYITSPNIYDPPTIDPAYLSHPADIVVLRQAIKLIRTIAASSPFASNITAEFQPGAQIQSDPDVEAYIRSQAASEFHPSGTCAMLPMEQGGVVDARFKVYNVQNLRVVDSSVFPLPFSAHLMSSTYALAETGASLILSELQSPGGSSTGNTTPSKKNKANKSGNSDLVWTFFVFVSIMGGLVTT